MGSHRGDHDIAFFEAAVEETRKVTVTAAGLTQFPDADGPLTPGRYLIQAVGISAGQDCWLHVGQFAAGVALAPAIGPVVGGPKRFPLTTSVPAIETHVLSGYSDQMAFQLSAGANIVVYVTRVSTAIRSVAR